MFNQRIFNDQENFEDSSFNPADFPPSFFSSIPLENFGPEFFPRDDPAFYMPPPDFDMFEQGLPFLIDPAMYQSFQEDFKKFIPGFDLLTGFSKDGGMADVKPPFMAPKPSGPAADGRKIGTISADERRLKVNKFLEKRKRRVFKKRISYECRKRVADSRIRVKGRFVTKQQASLMVTETDSVNLKKEEDI